MSTVTDPYPACETVSIDRRYRALARAIDDVKAHHDPAAIALRNVAALIDGVADAIVTGREDLLLIRASRLLGRQATLDVVDILRGDPPTTPGGEA